jgi:hypothetical protein
MKQHITVEELMELTPYQRDRLNDLWIPRKYDLAAAFICKDAGNNEYDIFEYVIGHVSIEKLRSGYNVTLINIESIRSLAAAQEETDDEPLNEDLVEDDFIEEDFCFEYERPDLYSKNDCLPLLNVGQMLEILKKCGYGNGKFYVSIDNEGKNGIGQQITEYESYGMDYEDEELCNVLWSAVKEAL